MRWESSYTSRQQGQAHSVCREPAHCGHMGQLPPTAQNDATQYRSMAWHYLVTATNGTICNRRHSQITSKYHPPVTTLKHTCSICLIETWTITDRMMSSTMVTGSVNARTVRLSAPTAQLQPVRFLGSRQPLQRHQSKALFAKRRAGQVVAKAATEEKPDVAKVGDPPFLLELCGVHRIAMTVTLQPSFCREVSAGTTFQSPRPSIFGSCWNDRQSTQGCI